MKTNNRILLTAAILSVISAGANAENIITLENNHTAGSNYNLVSTVGNVKVDTEVPKNENTVHNVILGGWSKYTGSNIYNIFSGTEVAPSGRNVENIAIGDVVKIKDSSYGLMIGNHIINENDGESIKKYGDRSTMIKGDYITVKNSPHATVMGQHNNVTNSYGALVHGKDIVAENAMWSIVMGEGASAKLAQAGKGASVVIGPKANTNNYFTVSLGAHASTTAYAATAIGGASTANGKYSLAMAQGTANGYGAIAIGMNSKTDNDYAVAIGNKAKATGVGSMALGDDSVADRLAGTVGYLAEGKDDATWKSTKSALSVGDRENNVTRQITGLAAGTEDTDAVNVAQLKVVEAEAKKHSSVIAGDNTTVTTGTNAAGGVEYKVAVNKDLNEMNSVNFGKATDDVRSTVTKDGARFFNGSENIGVTSNGIQIENTDTLDQAKFDKTGMYASEGNKTVYYTTAGISAGDQIINNVKAGVADTDAVNVKQLKNYVNENKTYVEAGDNIEVAEDNGSFTVSTSKDLRDLNSVNLNDGNSQSSYTTEGINMTYRGTDREYHTSFKYDGMRIRTNDGDANPIDEISLTDKGLNNGGKRIINVDKGINGTDAVNVNQLRETEKNINDRINNTSNAATARANHYTDLQTAKVGARAAAMANLHYQDFNADDKWSFAAGYGHYKGANAGALGVAYQPNENTMVTVSSTIGSEPMVGAGVSMKFGKSSRMNANKQVAMAKEIEELRAIVAAQNAKIDALIDHAMGRNEAITDVVFPDVPENHWAYAMVQDLAYKGIVVGYPDKNFNGDLTLTRYEFAVALDRAITAGYMHPEMGRAIKEFKVELDTVRSGMHFRVDRLSGKDGAVDKVERVRVNKDNTRDNYGTIVK